jgi:hypothetical protein
VRRMDLGSDGPLPGDVSSELFVPMAEMWSPKHLRDDKLQRDWEWLLADRRLAPIGKTFNRKGISR